MKFIDWGKVNMMEMDGYISVQKHPTLDLYIYNYTQKCQFARMWTDETMQCRGLIADDQGNIIAQPFSKFFNLDEYVQMGNELPTDDFEVFDKLDGSLGILYWENGEPALATRGSFVSEQAIKGTEILREKYRHVLWRDDVTYLFEIIYPANRIVVDYGKTEDIFLLTVIDKKTGEEWDYKHMEEVFRGTGIPVVERFDGLKDFEEIKKMTRENAEGVVIKWPSGLRVKVKYDEYVRLHRIVTGVNAKRIWEHLKNNESLDELLERVPDEFYQWVTGIVNQLNEMYKQVEDEAISKYNDIPQGLDRKTIALKIKDFPNSGIIFRMLDKKDYSEIIWKLIKPAAERPFKEDIDA